MARKSYVYHYIYKTINLINGKFYIGMHSTNDLEDGYIGSGQRLWHSIKKYGRENFIKEILEYFPDRESLQNREIEIVNSDLLLDPLCMNISLGGRGTNMDLHSLLGAEPTGKTIKPPFETKYGRVSYKGYGKRKAKKQFHQI